MNYQFNDGGRSAAGFKGQARDCVCRAIAIATGREYIEIYNGLNEAAKAERPRGKKSRSSARSGIHKATTRRYMKHLGYEFVPTMSIGSGCIIHLRGSELPPGRLVVQLSTHVAAVIDGTVHDDHDPRRDGTRCVYGYYQITNEENKGAK